jgi:hypothetical protein
MAMTGPASIVCRQHRALRVALTKHLRRRGVLVRIDLGSRGPTSAGMLRVAPGSYWARAARALPALARALRVRTPRPVPGEA